jgi:hypothetical protein
MVVFRWESNERKLVDVIGPKTQVAYGATKIGLYEITRAMKKTIEKQE